MANYNLLTSAYLNTCVSGVTGWTNLQTFTSAQLDAIRNSNTVSVSGNSYIALEAQFSTDFFVSSLEIIPSASGQVVCSYSTSAGWETVNPVWASNEWEYTFPVPSGIQTARMFYRNTASGYVNVSFSANHPSTPISLSNAASGITTFQFSPDSSVPTLINITNNSSSVAIPKCSLAYTGNYEIDRNIFISTDYPTLATSGTASWTGIDSGGFMFPQAYDWSCGTFSGTEVFRRTLRLASSQISGSWTSPVLDIGYDPTWLYAYSVGGVNPTVEVRTSDTPPPKAHFVLVTTENTNENLMYKHKRLVFDDAGNLIEKVECNSPQVGNKLWRIADYFFAGKPLHYYACVNNRGTAAFLCPGITSCGDMDPIQEASDYSKWYNLCTRSLSSSAWNQGATVSGISWGSTKSVIYTKTFPIEDYDGFFTTTIVTDRLMADKYRAQVYLSYYDGATTRLSFPAITIKDYVFGPDDHIDVQYDYANNGWWIYLGGLVQTIYKTDVGSLNSTIVSEGDFHTAEDGTITPDNLYYGYQYSLDADFNFSCLVGIPDNTFSGFWALTSSGVFLYQEDFSSGTAALNPLCAYNYSDINTTPFSELHCGSCDSAGNLWAIDISQERLIRVNMQRVINGMEQPIDYDNNIDGILGVVPHPSDSTAFIFTSDEQSDPGQDNLRMVSASQSVGASSKLLYHIPGFCSAPYKYGTHFTGNVYTGVHYVNSAHPTWGTTTSGWQKYDVGKESMPRGRYKQFRISFTRDTTNRTSPQLQHIRIPAPISLDPLDGLQTKQIAIKTMLGQANSVGEYSSEIRLWWDNEGYNG
jgi:hypothetical protein